MILDLPKSYMAVLECAGEPNRMAFHGLHVDKRGLTCTNGKALAHLAWLDGEADSYKITDPVTVSIAAGVVSHGSRIRVDLSKIAEGNFPPWERVFPDVSRRDMWDPVDRAIDTLETLAKMGRLVDRQAVLLVKVSSRGLSGTAKHPDVGGLYFERHPEGDPIVEIGLRADVLAAALSAFNAGPREDSRVYWPKDPLNEPLVLVAGRLTVLAMPCKVE